MTSAIIFSARIVQNRSGLNLERIVARDVVGIKIVYPWISETTRGNNI